MAATENTTSDETSKDELSHSDVIQTKLNDVKANLSKLKELNRSSSVLDELINQIMVGFLHFASFSHMSYLKHEFEKCNIIIENYKCGNNIM